MALTDLRNPNNIFTANGSDFGMIAQLANTGLVSGTFTSLPVIKETALKDETDTPTVNSESGTMFYLSGGNRKASMELTFLQQDPGTTQLYQTVGGTNCCIVKQDYEQALPSGKYSWTIVPNAKIDKKLDLKRPGTDIKCTANAMPSTTAITLNLTSITANSTYPLTCASCVIPKGTIFAFLEF